MKDEKKTKAQLIAELVNLRQYVEVMKNTEIQRKKIQKALSESEETAQAILKATTDSLALLDRDGNILVLNEVTAKRHGKRADELVGMCVYDILPPGLAASRKAQCEDVVRSGQPVRFEDERDGKAFDNSLYPVCDVEGEVSAIAVYARDITEHKRVEKELRRSEEEFRGLFEHSPMGIYRTTPDGNILMVNTALVRMLGYSSAEELTRRNLEEDGYHPEYPRSEFKRRIHREEKILALESAWKRKDGQYVYVRESARAVFHNDGRPSFYEGMVEDITERRRAEEARDSLCLDMSERIKELQCMFGVTDSIRKREKLEEIAQDIVALIPFGWHYPEITRGKIRFDEKEFISEPFEETEWMQSSDIIVRGERRGSVESYFLEKCPGLDEGPFLTEERNLLDGIAKAFSEAVEHKQAEKALRESEKKLSEQNVQLQEKNIALRQVMEQVSAEKEQMERYIQANVDQLLVPLLKKMREKGSPRDRMYIDLLEGNLKNLTSSFGIELSMKTPRLTQREIEICTLILNGFSSKQMANLLNISYRSVETHRNHIRKKLDITNKGINLPTYIKNLQDKHFQHTT